MAETSVRVARVILLLVLFWTGGEVLCAHPAFDSRRAEFFLENGRLEEAEAAWQRARLADPDNPAVHYNLGIVQYRRRQYQDAARSWEKALRTGQEQELRRKTLHNLGNATFRMGDFASAVSAYQSSLEISEDAQTRFNLEQAEKKLKEEMERQKKQNQQDQQNQQQGQDGQQNQQNSDQKDGEQSKKGDQQKGDQQKGDQQNGDKQPGDQQNAADKEKDNSGQSSSQDQDGKDRAEQDKKNGKDPSGQEKGGNASETQEVAGADESKREDVSMGEPSEKGPPPPEASDLARNLKHQKVNPYRIEKILKDHEEREKEVQKRYRREPTRSDGDEIDPFFMSPEELHDFFERRRTGKPRQQEKQDGPDW